MTWNTDFDLDQRTRQGLYRPDWPKSRNALLREDYLSRQHARRSSEAQERYRQNRDARMAALGAALRGRLRRLLRALPGKGVTNR